MDCRRARYFLVASFDAPLDETTRKSLSYHLKDCRACRHEAFYYRELFSAEKQLDDRKPSPDFNERLLAAVRLREARAAWPSARPALRPRTYPRWLWVFVPALAATAALTLFWIQTGQKPVPDGGGYAQETAGSTAAQATAPNRATTGLPESVNDIPTTARPRYVYGTARFEFSSYPGLIFQIPPSTEIDRASPADPFASMVVAGRQVEWGRRTRAQTRYVLPIVSESTPRERIY